MSSKPGDEMTAMNISLSESMWEFVTDRATGRYASASEYIRDLIHTDQREAARENLESLLTEGLECGDPVEVTPEFWERRRQELFVRSKGGTKR